MPRQPRPIVPGIPLHIIQRGNNRLNCFFTDSDYLVFADLLQQAAAGAGCRLHAYVMMTNHVHMLVTPSHRAGPAGMMKALGERYVRYVNRRHQRTGTLWEGRYRSCLVDSERYLLVCQRYIELNPVRAHIVAQPADYPWSSYRANAHGAPDSLLTRHDIYLQLGADAAAREIAYRALFQEVLPVKLINHVRRAINGHSALGNKHFADEMARMLGRHVVPQEDGPRRKQSL